MLSFLPHASSLYDGSHPATLPWYVSVSRLAPTTTDRLQQFPDWLFFRLAIRFVFGLLHSVVPLSIIYTSLSIILYPAPVLILLYPRLISLDTLLAWEFPLQCVAIFYAIEALWLFLHTAGRALITRGIWDLKSEKEVLSSEERWRIWVKMLESTPDPWDWFGGMFMVAGSKGAPRGMEDPAMRGVKMRDVGRTNVEEVSTARNAGKWKADGGVVVLCALYVYDGVEGYEERFCG